MSTFDPQTGQIYQESKANVTRSMIPMWKHHTTGKAIDPQLYRKRTTGAARLAEMALRNCCWNALLFLPETLEQAGWWYAGMIYRRLKETDTLSFAAWTLFQEAFPGRTELSHHFSVLRKDTETSWPSIVEILSRFPNSVQTLVHTPGLTLSLQHLLSLTGVPSLAALVHVNPLQSRVSPLSALDLRTWARAVREKHACAKLKVLVLSGLSDVPDSVTLHHLSSFSVLTLVGIARSSLSQTGRSERKPKEMEAKKMDTQWVPLTTERAKQYTAALHGTGTYSQHSPASRLKQLYAFADPIANANDNHPAPVSLLMTCYGQGLMSSAEDLTWYVRQQTVSETADKRAFESSGRKEREVVAAKKRKVRQGKQQDVGALLGMFG